MREWIPIITMYGFIPSFPTKGHPVKPIRHVFIKQLFAGCLLKGGKMGLFLDRAPGVVSALRFLLLGMIVVLPLPGKKPGDWIDIMGQKLYDSVTLNHTSHVTFRLKILISLKKRMVESCGIKDLWVWMSTWAVAPSSYQGRPSPWNM